LLKGKIWVLVRYNDLHFYLLEVSGTFLSANLFTTPQMEALQDEIGGVNLPLELTLHLLGLRGVSDTIVGNAAVRGVSGGERHRVTTAEMVSGKDSIFCGMHLKFQTSLNCC
jgi:hypothetical protein